MQEKTEPTQDSLQQAVEEKIGEGKSKIEGLITREEAERMVSKTQSAFEKKWRDAEERASRAEKLVQQTQSQLVALEDEISKLQAERDERLFAGLDAEPQVDRLKSLYKELKTTEAELKKRQREFLSQQQEALEGLKFRDAWHTAKEAKDRYGVTIDPDELMKCNSYSEMVIKARDLVIESLKVPVKEQETKPEKEPVLPKHLDSGVQTASGTGRRWKASEIAAMTPAERQELAHEINLARKEGRIDFNA